MSQPLLATLLAVSTPAFADNPAATVGVNASANRRAISPLIYGANIWTPEPAGTFNIVNDLNLAVNRRGGNAATTYNWQINATNRAGDWYFESLGESNGPAPSAAADASTTATQAAGAEMMMTIPMVDWVAKLGPNRQGLAAYSVAKYGPQSSTDPWWPDAGNGVRASDSTHITTNDPNDAYTPNSPTLQQQWVQHLVNTFGPSSGGGIKYYLTDNEHGVWPWNHRPIMPVGQTMAQIRDRIIAYAGAVKAVDPDALIVGPEEWGWTNYFNSPFDTAGGNGADRTANGGWDYQPWLLKELKAHENSTGQRLLDVFSLHYYPQPGEFSQGDSSTAAQLMRNQCTRDLWDPNYVSTSWINNRVKLIPRMKEWVNAHYPGIKIAITEYSWGAEGHISGAIAQADVLGIFGREGVDLATFWGGLDGNLPVRNAFKMYRNYDGAKSTFGDTSVAATVANPDNVAAFAAERSSDGALTVMVINKYLSDNTPVSVNLASFAPGSAAQVWQFTSANTINRLADAGITNGNVSFSAPAQSITLLVIPSGSAPDIKARYNFEGNAQDTGGNGNHGTATALNYVTGMVGAQAAQFNGTGGTVTIPRSVTDDFTVAMWAKTTDNAGWPGAPWWAGKGLVDGEVGGGGADWGTALVDGKFVLGVGAVSGDTTLSSSVNINDGAWHHVAATRNNTSGAMTVYVDGVLRGSGTGATGSRTFPSSLRIGSLQTGNNFLNGTLDDVRLYDRLLTASEITVLAANTLPATPTGVLAAGQGNQVSLSWPPVAGASGYNVKRSGTSGGPYTTVATNVTAASHPDTELNFGATYYYVVTASNVLGESANSAEAAVTLVSLTTATLNSVGVQDGYVRGADDDNTVGGAASTSTPSRLGDGTGNLQYKAIISFETSSLPDHAVIVSGTLKFKRSGLTGTNPFTDHGTCHADIRGGSGFSGSTTLENSDFQAVAGASQVATMSNPAANGGWSSGGLNAAGLAQIDKTAATQFRVCFSTPADGDNDNDYITWFTGNDATSSNRPVLELHYYLDTLPPSPPAGLTATGADAAVSLSWNASGGATSYTLWRSLASGSGFTMLPGGTTTQTNHTDTSAINGTTYHYVVRAANAGGSSGDSNQASAMPLSARQSWRLTNFGTIASTGSAADSADPDGDGWTNEQEYISATDPNSRASLLKFDTMQAGGNDVNLSFPSILGRTYRVEWSDSLHSGSWTSVQDNIPGTGGPIQVTDIGGSGYEKRFYRIVVRQ